MFEYEVFLLHAVPYLAEPRRAAVKKWLNELGAEGWDVFWIGPQNDYEAGLAVWAKRRLRGAIRRTDTAGVEAGKS